MPNAYGRAFTTANFLANLTALKAINFGASDPTGVWFVVPNLSTNNIEIWVWQPTSMAVTNEISVVRPDSVPPSSPGRCIQSLRFDASNLGGILSAIAALNTAGLIERTADGSASIVSLGTFGRSFLGSASDTAARTALNLGNITNTSDANKPVSTAQQTALSLKADITALNLKANIVSPAFTGIPTVPTATAGTNTTQAASTAFVGNAVAALVNSSPAVLDTLGELATALGNDPNFATTMTSVLATKAPLISPAFSGVPTVPTAVTGTNTLQVASTAFVGTAVANLAPLVSPVFTGTPTVTGLFRVTNTTQSTSTTTGASIISGGQAVQGNQYTQGFTLLGDNIAVKQKQISGTTGTTGTDVSVAHGLTGSTIRSVTCIVTDISSRLMAPGMTLAGAQNEYYVYTTNTLFVVYVAPTNSSNVVSRPFTALITYTT